MAKREIKRNGRGQIVSYEIGRTIKDQFYGEVLLSNTNAQEFEKYNTLSFRANVDSDIVEFAENEEYQSQPTTLNIPIPGFNINQSITLETTTAALVASNPQVDLGYIALPYINPNVNSGDLGGNTTFSGVPGQSGGQFGGGNGGS